MDLRFSMEGDEIVRAELLGVSKRGRDLSIPFGKVAKYYFEEIDRNFSARGGTWGAWAARKNPAPHPLLQKTGRMRGSFTEKITKNSVEISNRDPKFVYHQSSAPRKALPRRAMFGINENDRRSVVRILQRYLMEK